MWNNAWDDAMELASAAWTVLNERRNEVLVWAYWFDITAEQRTIVEKTFYLAAHSGKPGAINRFHFACGDFVPGDESTSGLTVSDNLGVCDDPQVNAYCRLYGHDTDIFFTATNDIAGCAMLNPDRNGRILLGDRNPVAKQRFCDETDYPHIDPRNIAEFRRIYFRGWTLLHELTHSSTVGFHIFSQGPGHLRPHLGTSDFAYGQIELAKLDASVAVLNAESYSNFAWDAFYFMTCGRRPQNMVNPADLMDEDWVAEQMFDDLVADTGP